MRIAQALIQLALVVNVALASNWFTKAGRFIFFFG